MFSFKLFLLAALGFILLGSSVGAAKKPIPGAKPQPTSPSSIEFKGRCYSLPQKNWNLISNQISHKLVQGYLGDYRLTDPYGVLLWSISTKPLQITSYTEQVAVAYAVAIQLSNGPPFMFTIGKRQLCEEAVDPTYAQRIKTEKVVAVYVYQLKRFP